MKEKDVRILTPKELWKAMGFPVDYTIDQSERRKEIRRNICLIEAKMKREMAV